MLVHKYVLISKEVDFFFFLGRFFVFCFCAALTWPPYTDPPVLFCFLQFITSTHKILAWAVGWYKVG